MREFYLLNEIGERYDLNTENCLFTNPAGLGTEMTSALADMDDGFYLTSKETFTSGQIVGDVNFCGHNPYADYRAFVDWCYKGYKLIFGYKPYGAEEYYCDVDLTSLAKSDIGSGAILSSTIMFTKKTPWYKPTARLINIEPSSAASPSSFDLVFDFEFVNDEQSGEISVNSNGHLPSALKVVADGALVNPTIELTKNGSTISKMELDDLTVSSGSVLTWSSVYTDCRIDVDGVSKISKLNLANENFFRIPMGDGYKLKITSEQAVSLNAVVYVYDYYRSV